jgi:hypothetical protein
MEEPVAPAPLLCTYCHQPILPTYYFCPNCGTKINNAPLSTSVGSQLLLYAHSAILPPILYITVGKWQAVKYYKSSDPKTKNIGAIAIIIMTVSTLITIWLTYALTEAAIQSQVAGINADMSAQGQ